MNKEEFINEVKELDVPIDDKKIFLIDKYLKILVEYNKHTNLTAITNEEDIYLKHFYDSLTIVKVVNLNDYSNLLDVGTGAGFPGMIIKIFYPHLNVTLVDSNGKKTEFLHYISNELDIEVNIINKRIEEFSKDNLNKFDIVTSRAVANLRVLSELCMPLIKKGGLFIPLKGKMDNSLEDSIDTIEILSGEIVNHIEFSLYKENNIRNIIVIKKNKNTDIKQIRTYDKILKKPLK